jgi:hypothetical protein
MLLDMGRRNPRSRCLGAMVAVTMAIAACGGPPAGYGGAQDVQHEIDAAKATTPLPPGAAFSPIKLDPSGTYQSGSGTNMIQFQAVCAWFGYWASAIASSDAQANDRSSKMADEIRTWSTYRTSDSSLRSYWDSIIDQARLGDAGGLVEMIKNNC